MTSRVQLLLLFGLAVILTGCNPPSDNTISLVIPEGYKAARKTIPEDNLSWEQKASMAMAVADAEAAAEAQALAASSDFAPKTPAYVALQVGMQAAKAEKKLGRIVSSKKGRGIRHHHKKSTHRRKRH